jgi:hypothetical protein
VPAPLLGVEHDGLARCASADAEPLLWQCHGRKGAGVPCASQVGSDAGSALLP